MFKGCSNKYYIFIALTFKSTHCDGMQDFLDSWPLGKSIKQNKTKIKS